MGFHDEQSQPDCIDRRKTASGSGNEHEDVRVLPKMR
jgi:hypothetical protein